MNMTRRVESVGSHCGLNSKDPRYPWPGTSGCKAIYETVYVDDRGDRGEQLNGGRMYRLHLEETPAVDAYCSLTTYDTPNYYPVDDPMERSSIGDRSAGLVYNRDGSLDNHIQHDSPGGEGGQLAACPGRRLPSDCAYVPATCRRAGRRIQASADRPRRLTQ